MRVLALTEAAAPTASPLSSVLQALEAHGFAVTWARPEAAEERWQATHAPVLVLDQPSPDLLAVAAAVKAVSEADTMRAHPLVIAIAPGASDSGSADTTGQGDSVDLILAHDIAPAGLVACLRLVARLRQQEALAHVGAQALEREGLSSLFRTAVDAVADVLGVPLVEVLLRREDGEPVLDLVAGRGWPAGLVGDAAVPVDTATQAGYVLQAQGAVVVEDAAEEERFAPHALLREHGVVSSLGVALRGEDGVYGVLGAHATTPRTFAAEAVAFLERLARMLGDVLAGAVAREEAVQALRESETRARSIVETTVDAVITIDERGRIASFNPAAERIFGYTPGEVVGQNVKVLMPQPYREEHDGYMQSYRETGRRRIIGIGREVVGLRKDGTTFPMDLAVSEMRFGDRVMFTGLIRDISDRRRLEQEILRISEQERRRIGQDLHDGLGQMLTGIGLIAQNLARTLRERDAQTAGEVAEIVELIRDADQHARGLARGLVPVDLESTGLSSALQRLAHNAERLFGIRCAFDEVGSPLLDDNSVATHLYRIAQEGVSNAVKHGRAETVKVRLASGAKYLRLRVEDDGIGFPDELDEETRGMGVRIMHYRARMIGASLDIMRNPDRGTVLTCTLRHFDGRLPRGGEEYGPRLPRSD